MSATLAPAMIFVGLLAASPMALAEAPPSVDDLLVDPSFETGPPGEGAPWRVDIGAQQGDGPASEVAWDEALAAEGCCSLRLSGKAKTAVWRSVDSVPVPVEPGVRYTLSGQLRAEEVRREGRQFSNANLALLFRDARGEVVRVGGYPVVGSDLVTGSTDWRRVQASAVAPEGAATVEALVFLSMSGTLWADDLRLEEVAPPDWIVEAGPRHRFHYLAEAPLSAEDQGRNLAILEAMEDRLETELPVVVDFFRYPDNATKGRHTGMAGNAHVTGDRQLHTVWSVDDHEIVHLITRTWGPSGSALLGEGIAVWLSEDWQGEPVHDVARRLLAEGELPGLADLVSTGSFRTLDDLVTYPAAGSFVGWFLEEQGLEAFRRAYLADGAEDTAARLEAESGLSLPALEARWRAWLGGEASPEDRVRIVARDHKGRVLAEWVDTHPCGRAEGQGATMALSHRGRAVSISSRCTEAGEVELGVHRFTWVGAPAGPVVELHAATGSAAELSLRPSPGKADALTVSFAPYVASP